MSEQEPFAAERFELDGGVTLERLTAPEAGVVAQRLAQMEPWLGRGYSAAGLEGYLNRTDPCLRRFAVLVDGSLGGVIAVRHPWLRGAYIELLGLFPACQGRGLGGRLIDWTVRESRPRGRNLWVAVSESNEAARRFYARHGFELTGELPDLVQDGFTELLLLRKLGTVN